MPRLPLRGLGGDTICLPELHPGPASEHKYVSCSASRASRSASRASRSASRARCSASRASRAGAAGCSLVHGMPEDLHTSTCAQIRNAARHNPRFVLDMGYVQELKVHLFSRNRQAQGWGWELGGWGLG